MAFRWPHLTDAAFSSQRMHVEPKTPLGLRLLGQLFVWLNGPVSLMLAIFRTPAPEFVSVSFCAGLVVKTTWFVKVRLVGEKVTAGNTPTPVNGKDCGLLGALSVMVTAAFSRPVPEGVKVTLILQLPLEGMKLGQLFVWAKSAIFRPVT
jgi:hypothetical protein